MTKIYLSGDRFIAQLDEDDMKPSISERRGTKPNKSTISYWSNDWYKFKWFQKFKRWIKRRLKKNENNT